ncbi:MAG: hypothetical protein V3U60_11005, partial [Gammaproteobacteria bacterium]
MPAPDKQSTLSDAEFLFLERERARARLKIKNERGAVTRFTAGTSRGVAKTVGAPVDIVSSLLKVVGLGDEAPLGGSENLQAIFERLGVGVPAEEDIGRAGRVGELVGTTAVAAPAIVAGGVRSLAAGIGEVTTQPTVSTAIVQDIARTAMRNPVTFAAQETAAAVGAGLASFEAAQRFPNSPGAQALAEIGGGLAPALATTGTRLTVRGAGFIAEKAPGTGAIIRGIRQAVTAVSTPAQTKRAIARTQRATPDPGASARRLGREDVLPEAPLTGPQKAGDPQLLALERSVMEQNVDLSAKHAQQFADVNTAIRKSLVSTPVDDVPIHQAKAYFTDLLDTRIQQAAVAADEKLAALGANATREDLNRLARQELDKARIAGRAQEKELYDSIPDAAEVPTQAGQDMLEHFRLTTPKAQRKDIPADAAKFLRPTKKAKDKIVKGKTVKGKEVANPDYLGDVTTIEEVRGLQGSLRETARRARAENRFNEARIADEIADSLSDDVANAVGGAEVRESVDVAVAFSRDFNDRFTRGPVGKLLATERTGGSSVDPSLTLETTVGKRGPRAAVETDALLNAVARNGDVPVMREHIQGFLIDDFRRAAVAEGRIDNAASTRWLNDNQDTLARFPELKRSIEQAQAAGGRLVDAQRMADPKISRAAVFVNAPPGQELERVLKTARPREAMQELVKLAKTDPTGKAEEGLKAAFFELLLKKSQTTTLGVDELPIISGRNLTEQMSREPVIEAARGLLTKAEMRRLNQTRETALLMDKARASKGAVEGVIGDEPNILFSILARVGGAQVGRVIAGKTGGGTVQTPQILSSQVRTLLRAGVQ